MIKMKYLSNKNGKMPLWGWLVIGVVVLTAIGLLAFNFGKLSSMAEQPATEEREYDGEFEDAFLATEAEFYSDFSEDTDCNITNDVLGGSGYISCIYDAIAEPSNTTEDGYLVSGQEYRLDLAFEIDEGPVENMEIEAELQNSGTGQAKDDVSIKESSLWTYDDEDSRELSSLSFDNEDGEINDETGVLEEDEYVFHTILKTKDVDPNFADGDDIMLIDFDLDSSGDVDEGRITLQA